MPFEFKIVRNALGATPENIKYEEFRSQIEICNWKELPESKSILLIHPKDVPWLVADWHPETNEAAHITFNVSWGHYRFALVWSDAFDLALKFADSLNAQVIEDTSKSIVTTENVDKLLDFEGQYFKKHIDIWNSFKNEVESTNKAPFEYPVGPMDAVSEFFALRFMPSSSLTLEDIIERYGLTVEAMDETFVFVMNVDIKKPRIKLLHRADGYFQLRPFYWYEPFSVVADQTLTLAEKIREDFGGDMWFYNDLYTNSVREEIRAKINGFGADFYQWRYKVRLS